MSLTLAERRGTNMLWVIVVMLSIVAGCVGVRSSPVDASPATTATDQTCGQSGSNGASPDSTTHLVDLGTYGGVGTYATAIDDSGFIAGASGRVGGPGTLLRWTPDGTVENLGTLGGTSIVPFAMNSSGEIVGTGTMATGAIHAFRWTSRGGLEDLGAFGGSGSLAWDINDSGTIVGEVDGPGSAMHAFIIGPGQPVQVIAAAGDNAQAMAINDSGVVVGNADGAPFRWTASGGLTYLPTPHGPPTDV